jgi:hypothetical protein
MRDNMFGRWVVRLAVTFGAGAVALGAASVAANASDLQYRAGVVSQSGAASLISVVSPSVSAGESVYITEDFGWG